MLNAEKLGKHRFASQTYTHKKITCIPSCQARNIKKLNNLKFHTLPSGVVSKYVIV